MSILNLLIRVLGQPGDTRDQGRQHDFNCPYCADLFNEGKPDNKYNLGVNLARLQNGKLTKVYHCWKCENGGDLGHLLRTWGGYEYYEQYQALTAQDELGLRLPQVKETRVIRLPREYLPFFGSSSRPREPSYAKALDYLRKRGISDAVVEELRVGYCPSGRYQERIIIPSHDRNGVLNYFAARSYVGHEDKYRNPTVDKMSIIFNESGINWDAPVFLTEGPFELLAFPHNNVVLLGKVLPDLLLQQLVAHKARVIVAINQDAKEDKTKQKPKHYGDNVKRERAASVRSIVRQLLDSGLEHVKWWNYPENDLARLLQLRGVGGIFQSLASDVQLLLPDSSTQTT
jgi:hypothetical protein